MLGRLDGHAGEYDEQGKGACHLPEAASMPACGFEREEGVEDAVHDSDVEYSALDDLFEVLVSAVSGDPSNDKSISDAIKVLGVFVRARIARGDAYADASAETL